MQGNERFGPFFGMILLALAAWAYVGLRAVHSVTQCTTNIVMRRFAAYMASPVVLWAMVLGAVAQFV